ncbi:MAG: hypothetical protein ABIP55_03780 [Tepidisphaeraceae bacterium]
MKFASKDDVLTVEGADAMYSLRVPTKRDKIEFARRIRAAGGRAHGPAAIIARVMRVIELKFAADLPERDRLLEIVRGFATERNRIEAAMGPIVTDLFRFIREVAAGRATIADMPATLSRFESDAASFLPLQEAYSRIENLCERLDDVLADLFADNAQYGAVHNYIAAEMFLTGALPKPKPDDESEAGAATSDKPPHWLTPGLFRIAGGRVVAQFLDAMPDADVGAAGDAIWNAMSPSEPEKKSSALQRGRPPAAASSTASSTGLPSSPHLSTPPETPPTAG